NGKWAILHNGDAIATSALAIATSAWTHVVAVYSGGAGVIYVNGSASNGTLTPDMGYGLQGTYRMGGGFPGYNYQGVLDEVRVSAVARSAGWIGTEFNNQSSSASFATVGAQVGNPIPLVIVTTSPSGLSLTVDGAACTAPCMFEWTVGSSHTIAAATQAGTAGTQYVFATWSDGGAASHNVTGPASGTTTYTASFTTQYFLSTVANPQAGTIRPSSGWYNAATSVAVSATAGSGYEFTGFSGGLTGTTTPQNLVLYAPVSVTASFGLSSSFPTGWARKQKVTIQHGQVAADLVDFPVLLTEVNFYPNGNPAGAEILDADGPWPASPDGGDIRVSLDAAGAIQLPCEIGSISLNSDPSLSTLQVWVKVPNLYAGSDVDLYVWYGRGPVSQPAATDPFGAHAVWDSHYKYVAHLEDKTGTTVLDSTGTGNGVASRDIFYLERVGKIDGGFRNTWGYSDYTTIANPLPTAPNSELTFQFWFNQWPVVGTFAISSWNNTKTGNSGGNLLLQYNAGTLRMLGNQDTGAWTNIQSIANNTWYAIALRKKIAATGPLEAYINGVLVASQSADNSANSNASNIYWGSGYPASDEGYFDEVRVSDIWRSPEWMLTEYNNQNTPASFAVAAAPGAGDTSAPSRQRRQKLTIQHTQVVAGPASFPVLLTEASFYPAGVAANAEILAGAGPNHAQTDGGDLVFYDSTGTRLPCEIVQWSLNNDPALSKAEIYVRVPALSATADTDIWVYYMGSGSEVQPAGDAAYGAQAVWDWYYEGVYHFRNVAGALQAADSTRNHRDGAVVNATPVAGQIGAAGNFDGVSGYVNCGSFPKDPLSTFEVWINPTTYSQNSNTGIVGMGADINVQGIGIINSKVDIRISNGSSAVIYQPEAFNAATFPAGWHHLAFTEDSSNVNYYKDGAYYGSTNPAVANGGTAQMLSIGRYGPAATADSYFTGKIDEVRISKTPRSAGWLQTQYHNHTAPASFVVASLSGAGL
ncbi:MAG: DUF2341 domain-containing protein, partial [Candidatus Solibacter sp.]